MLKWSKLLSFFVVGLLTVLGSATCTVDATDDLPADESSRTAGQNLDEAPQKPPSPDDRLGASQGFMTGFDVHNGRATATLLGVGLDMRFNASTGVLDVSPTPSVSTAGRVQTAQWSFSTGVPTLERGKRTLELAHRKSSLSHSLIRSDYSRKVQARYNHDNGGLEQQFVLSDRLIDSNQPLQIMFDTQPGFASETAADGASLQITRNGQPVFGWKDLIVFDANDERISAQFVTGKRSYGLEINDADAVYPLSIDPVMFTVSQTVPPGGGSTTEAQAGFAVEGVGDLNGDTYDDVVVGASNYSNGENDEGRILAFLGSATGTKSTANVSIESNLAGSIFGSALGKLDDHNGDGYADLIVGARFANSLAGKVYVFEGQSTSGSQQKAINPTPAWTKDGAPSSGLGYGVDSGDFDCDGFDDVIASEPISNSGNGGVAVFFGDGTTFGNKGSYASQASGEQLGTDIAVGNVDGGTNAGNDCDDILAGGPRWDSQFAQDAGRAILLTGNANRTLTSPAWTYEGSQASSFHGADVELVDLNDDGYAELLVGANQFDSQNFNNVGRLLVFDGASPLSSLSTTPDYAHLGFSNGERFASAIATAGDVNNDGFNDLLLGARKNSSTLTNEGAAYLFLGSTSGLLAQEQWKSTGSQAGVGQGAEYGQSVSTAGDVDNDGYDDFVIGANFADVTTSGGSTLVDAGQVVVYRGQPTCFADGAFWDDGDENPNNVCKVCDAAQGSVTGWTNVANMQMKPCVDGDMCTTNDVCVSGVCEGTPRDCSVSGQACTEGYCDAADGQCKTRGKATTVQCAPATCASATQAVAASHCDGDVNGDNTGVCEMPAVVDCAPFKCDQGACRTECSNDSQCAGGAHCDKVTDNCSTANRAPVADAGSDKNVTVGDAVTLDGSESSDPDGDMLDYQWTQIRGEQVTLSDDTAESPQFTAPQPSPNNAVLTFELVVSDGELDSPADEVSVLITDQPNEIPVAVISGPDGAEGGETITLSGEGSSDADGDELTFKWSRVSGQPAPTFDSTSDETFTVTFPEVSTERSYAFQLVVNDGKVSSESVTHEVVVTPVDHTGGDAVVDAGTDTGGADDAGDTDHIGETIDNNAGDLSGSSCACESVQHEQSPAPVWLVGAFFLGGLALVRRRRYLG